MKTYYSQRASTYDQIYARPERQADLTELERQLLDRCAGKRVLDLGCGTGYWLEKISEVAESLVGIDFSESVLSVAAERNYSCPVELRLQSFYGLEQVGERFEVVLGGFVVSHIPRLKMPDFLAGLGKVLATGGRLFLFDNRYVEGNSTPISRTDEAGNTYQTRHLENGQTFEVLKNFPVREDWDGWVPEEMSLVLENLEYFWWIEIKGGGLP